MAFLTTGNVAIRGIAACVPELVEENIDLPLFLRAGEAEKVIASTGISRKRILKKGQTTSDLCAKSAEKLLSDLNWDNNTIDALIFVSPARDYIIPPTSSILQDKLGLSDDCYTFDIPSGCPGWIQGINVLASLISNGDIKRGLVLAGDAPTLLNSPKDKETRPLFGDAGTATALEFSPNAAPFHFLFGTDGKKYKAIFTEDGGCRNPVNEESLREIEYAPNVIRRKIDCKLDGMEVFAFGLAKVPSSVVRIMERFNISDNQIDYYLFHQANLYMNEKIRKKLKIDPSKVPYSLRDFGNTSCASIPLTIVTQRREDYTKNNLNSLACSFGTGLNLCSFYFTTSNIVCPELIEFGELPNPV
ncbi:MAG: ketoacyl-ACP synthase III [Planctomycetaceae bacterium]|jgi:3-oxoacyl-[acyl-carrier-protein] synthase-3|nr:ketoacyl-ACP synthase III [Planctomycetaceae bacterium]